MLSTQQWIPSLDPRLKAHQEPCEHRLGGVAQVPAKLELAEVLRHVFAADMNVRATDRPFEHGPEALKGIGVMDAVNPLIDGMIDGAVCVTVFCQTAVCDPLVCANSRARTDVFKDVPFKGSLAGVRDDWRHDIAATLGHAEHHCLARRAPPALAARTPPADVGFVSFNVPRQWRITINFRHVFADLVAHAPRAFIGHAKLALQFLGRHAMPRRGEQVCGVKPLLKRRARLLENCSGHRMNMMPAIAGVGGHLPEPVESINFTAFRANRVLAELEPEKVIQACVIVRKAAEKILNSKRFSHRYLLITYNMGITPTYVKGIITKLFSHSLDPKRTYVSVFTRWSLYPCSQDGVRAIY